MSRDPVIDDMALHLAGSTCDLADERAALKALVDAGFHSGDIIVNGDLAIQRAREQRVGQAMGARR